MTTRFNSAGASGLLTVLAVLMALFGCGLKIEKATSDPPFVKPANPGRSTVLVVPKQQPAAPVATLYPPGRAIFKGTIYFTILQSCSIIRIWRITVWKPC